MPVIKDNHHKVQHQKGFNLIENMVTLFVLTIGLLGAAGMQAIAINAHRDGTMISEATILAQNMAERVRANLSGLKDGFYNQGASSNTGNYTSGCFTTAGCTSSQMAHTDLFQWQQELAAVLPDGQGVICRYAGEAPSKASLSNTNLYSAVISSCGTSGDTYVIHVMWERYDDTQLRLVSESGALNPNSSDGYVQLVFNP